MLLRSVDYGESDRIVTLLTTTVGKVSAIARSARRSKRRFGGALQPYVLMRATLRKGRGELAHLNRVEVVHAYMGILSDLERIDVAGAALRFVREVIEDNHPDPRAFSAVTDLLEALEAGGDPHTLAAAFRVRMFAVLGHAPSIEACFRCGKRAESGRAASFEPRAGAIVCTDCGGGPVKLSGQAREHLQQAMRGDWRPKAPYSPPVRDAIERVIEAMIHHQLDTKVTQVARTEPRKARFQG